MAHPIEQGVRQSFRMEMIGAGIYSRMARQYRKKNLNLSEQLRAFSDHEAMHGRLFRQYARKRFGQDFGSGTFWKGLGSMAAILMRPIPLKKKLKKLHTKEADAVLSIEERLEQNLEEGLRTIMRTILPHEKAHAAFYAERYPE